MKGSMVAKRYALALFQIAREQRLLEKVEEELRVVKEVLYLNEDLKSVLKSPKLSKEKKKQILKTSFSSLDKYVFNTLMLLIDRHRQDEIIPVAEEFIELANQERGVEVADVYSIRPLSDEERAGLS